MDNKNYTHALDFIWQNQRIFGDFPRQRAASKKSVNATSPSASRKAARRNHRGKLRRELRQEPP
jgi:hypothetical protein